MLKQSDDMNAVKKDYEEAMEKVRRQMRRKAMA